MSDRDEQVEAVEKAAKLEQERRERVGAEFERIREKSKAERAERWRKQARAAVGRAIRESK